MSEWINLFTDGSCIGNPGPGGWGVLLYINGTKQELFGGEANTTNNRMELTAVIKGLEAIPKSSKIRITTDSQYVKDGITKWIENWKRKGWITAGKEPVKNRDLWEQLDTLIKQHQQTQWLWVHGHSGHVENERVDLLANKGAVQASNITMINQELIPDPKKIAVKKSAANKRIIPHKDQTTRQIILDTETTGLATEEGHRIIEIGGIELMNRRLTHNNFHKYLQPDRAIDEGANKVHGITNEFLADKPRFADIAEEFITYLQDAELIVHNASFDIGFLDAELQRWSIETGKKSIKISHLCAVTDTLILARAAHPGQRNSLDALCRRYNIDQSKRTLHGALLDAQLLAQVYLAMTGGQSALLLNVGANDGIKSIASGDIRYINPHRLPLPIIRASTEEATLHQQRLQQIDSNSDGQCVWNKIE